MSAPADIARLVARESHAVNGDRAGARRAAVRILKLSQLRGQIECGIVRQHGAPPYVVAFLCQRPPSNLPSVGGGVATQPTCA